MNVIDGKEHNQNQLQNYYMYAIIYVICTKDIIYVCVFIKKFIVKNC